MDQLSETTALGRVEPYIRKVRSPAACRAFLALDDCDVQSECRMQALQAIRAFRSKRDQSNPDEELRFARTAIRNRLISLVRRAGANNRVAVGDKAMGTMALLYNPEPFDPCVETGYLEAEAHTELTNAIRVMLHRVGKGSFNMLQPRIDSGGLRRASSAGVEQARARAARVLGLYAFHHMGDHKEGLMTAVKVKDLSDDDLTRIALVQNVELESQERAHLEDTVTNLNTDPDTGETSDFPVCFTKELELDDETCNTLCDFFTECHVVSAGRAGENVPDFEDVEAALVQIKKSPAPSSSEPIEVAMNEDGEFEPVASDLDSEEDPSAGVDKAAPPSTASPAKKKAKKKAAAKKKAREPVQTDIEAKIDEETKKVAKKKVKSKAKVNQEKAEAAKAHTPEVGFIYASNDKRIKREFQVVSFEGDKVVVENVDHDKSAAIGKRAKIRLEILGNTTNKGFTHLPNRKPKKLTADAPDEPVTLPAKTVKAKKAAKKKKTTKKAAKKAAKKKTTKKAAKKKAAKKKTTKKAAKKKTTKKTAPSNGVIPTLSGRTLKPQGGYSKKANGERYTRLPQGSAAELARLPVGTEVDRLWDGYRYYAKKIEDGRVSELADGRKRKRDGVWELFKKVKVKADGSEGSAKKYKKPFHGSLNQVARHITGSNAWSGARFFSVLPPQLNPASDRFDPTKYKPEPVYSYS